MMKSMALDAFSVFSGSTVTGGPTKQTFSFALDAFIISAIRQSTSKPGVEVKSTSNSKSRAISTVCSMEILCGGASPPLLSGGIRGGGRRQPGNREGSVSPRSGPAGTRPSVEALKRRRIQKQRSHAQMSIVRQTLLQLLRCFKYDRIL